MLDRQIAANRRKALGLLAVGFLMLAGLTTLLWAVLDLATWVIIPLAAIDIGLPWLAYFRSDRLVIASTRAKDADPATYPTLHHVVEEMSIAAGLPKPRVMIVDDPAPNAFATGRNERHAVVAVTTGLLAAMDREQLQGVIAHEMSHIANRDMLVATVAASITGALIVLSNVALRIGVRSTRSRSPVLIVLLVVAAVLAPIAAALLKASISRKRELLADVSATKLTRNPAGLRRALETLAADGAVIARPSNVTAHLWIEEPVPDGGAESWFKKLFNTHPPLAERIYAMRRLEGGGAAP